MAASTQVEAKSLSAINHLAANPPQYPINPTGKHETLCLYISRVPGSRDIILSTHKPQRSNVTGEDVAQSLYYIHLDNLGDELLVPGSQRHENAPRASMESTASQEHRIARKPVPAGVTTAKTTQQQPQPQPQQPATSAVLEQPQPPPQYHNSNKENVPLVQPYGGSGAAPSQQSTASQMGAVIQQRSQQPSPSRPAKVPVALTPVARKPIGPRMTGEPSSPAREDPPLAARNNQPYSVPGDEGPRAAAPKPNLAPLRFDEMANTRSHTPVLQSPLTPSRSPSPWNKQQKPFTPFSLTIIRRNPITGHQWNIGKVSSFQSTILYQDPNSPDAAPIVQYPRGYPAINIHIETSGYARFRNFSTIMPKINLDSVSRSSGNNIAESMKELAAQMQAQQQQQEAAATGDVADDGLGGFKRQVTMSYGKTWTHNLKEKWSSRKRDKPTTTGYGSDNDHLGGQLRSPEARFHQRNDSGGSAASYDSSYFPPGSTHYQQQHPTEGLADHSHHMEDQPNVKSPGPGLRPKGYTFTSPWGGSCDFRTSSSGRSLKCRHTRNTTSQGFNPLVVAQALRDAASTSNGDGERKRGRSRGLSASMSDVNSDKVDVCELRFSLPSTDFFNSKEDRERAAKEVVEGLGRMLVRDRRSLDVPRGNNADEEEDGDGVFDFSELGRERAGGGNKGNRAKLGKLLIHDEGLKMLDLVVAANMGIWWQAWERSF
ncbi:hypothetical protein BD289DRAFT_473719 [Coniella lustricola]|uniref:Uncharacterized protein n=1 Tax=Coniella lustricola TaxID=2025994 RepID=A0A2T3AAE2_9PEZI|nr:hypothetical protein BD289DRAFT_473719 [Coniella lustricola]